jgi:hypothetical protein
VIGPPTPRTPGRHIWQDPERCVGRVPAILTSALQDTSEPADVGRRALMSNTIISPFQRRRRSAACGFGGTRPAIKPRVAPLKRRVSRATDSPSPPHDRPGHT